MIPGLHMANQSIMANPQGDARERSLAAIIDPSQKTGNAGAAADAVLPGADKVDVFSRTASASRTSRFSVELSFQSKVLAEAMALLQTADAALVEIDNKLGEMAELAEEAAKPERTNYERAILNADFQKLKGDAGAVADTTTFHGEKILQGGDGPDGAFIAEFGTGKDAVTVAIPPITLADLSIELVVANISTLEGAISALENLREAGGNLDAGRRSIALQMASVATEQFMTGLAAAAEQAAAAGREVLDQPDALQEFSRKIAQDIAEQAGVFLTKGAAAGVQQLLTSLNETDPDKPANGGAVETSDSGSDAPDASRESTT